MPASPLYRQHAVERLEALVRHLEERYGDQVAGYHPCGQNTGEWFYDRLWDGRLSGLETCATQAFRDYLRGAYRDDDALRAAWRDPAVTLTSAEPPPIAERTARPGPLLRDPPAERRAIDWLRFRSVEMADAVEAMCRAVKDAAPRKLAVAFYGYHFEVAPVPHGLASSGHLALARLLDSPSVDVFSSPVSYLDRAAGGGGYFMAPVDSVQLHGKLWLVEDDTRTHLAAPDAGFGRVATPRETAGVLARNFAHLLTRGAAVWWMDLLGEGWYADEAIWEQLGALQEEYRRAMPDFRAYRPDVAVVVDEDGPMALKPSRDLTRSVLYYFRQEWCRLGAPAGIYLMSDLTAGRVPPARLYLVLDAFAMSEAQAEAVRREARRRGATVVWMVAPGYAADGGLSLERTARIVGMGLRQVEPGPGRTVEGPDDETRLEPRFAVEDPAGEPLARYADGAGVAAAAREQDGWVSVFSGAPRLSTDLLRALARRAGAHIYADSDDVVMAGNGFVAIHASSTGEKSLMLPEARPLRDCATGEVLPSARRHAFQMERGNTRLFRVLDAAAVDGAGDER